MSAQERLTQLIEYRDAIEAAIFALGGKVVEFIMIRGRQVKYHDATQQLEYLNSQIAKCQSSMGPARNKVRLGRV